MSNAVYQVSNYAVQEENNVPEGCWMEPNGNVRYNKGKSDKPCGYVLQRSSEELRPEGTRGENLSQKKPARTKRCWSTLLGQQSLESECKHYASRFGRMQGRFLPARGHRILRAASPRPEKHTLTVRFGTIAEPLRTNGRRKPKYTCVRKALPARHQRVDADRHETPPVRQGPRRLGIQARVGNAGRCPRLQTGILLHLSRKAQILLPRRSRRADVPIRPRRRYEFQKRRVRAVGRRPGQGLLHVLEREPRQGFPRPLSPGILRKHSPRHRRPVPKAREKVRRLLRFDHEHDHRRLRESVLVDGRVRGRRQVRKVRPALPLDRDTDDLPVRVQCARRQRGQYGQVHWGSLQWLQRQVRVLRVKKK